MTAAPVRKRIPTFYTSVDVDVDIDPQELEDAGWRYVGKEDDAAGPSTQTVLDVVRRWHDDTHAGPWQWCNEEPCDTLRGRGPA
jgi:hypothetical protein